MGYKLDNLVQIHNPSPLSIIALCKLWKYSRIVNSAGGGRGMLDERAEGIPHGQVLVWHGLFLVQLQYPDV